MNTEKFMMDNQTKLAVMKVKLNDMLKLKMRFAVLLTLIAIPSMMLANTFHDDEDDILTKKFSVSRGGVLLLGSSYGEIQISTWEKSEVLVKVFGLSEDEVKNIRLDQSGNTITVIYKPDQKNRNWNWNWNNRSRGSSSSSSLRFEISVPTEFNHELKTGAGEIQFIGKIKGNILASTSAGEVIVGDVNGNVELKTSGGEITVGTIRGNASLKTSGGEISVTAVSGNLDVSTAGGELRIGKVGGNLIAKTSGGDIFTDEVGGNAALSTAGGCIKTGKIFGETILKTSGGDIEMNGGNGVCSASTAGGSLKVYDVTGSITAKTQMGEVVVELTPEGKIQSQLYSGMGDVYLYLPTDAKAVVEARVINSGQNWNFTFPIAALPPLPPIPPIPAGVMDEEAKKEYEKVRREIERERKRIQREIEHAKRDSDRDRKRTGKSKNVFGILSDFKSGTVVEPDEEDESIKEQKATYVLNGGGQRIIVETANGNIYIKKKK